MGLSSPFGIFRNIVSRLMGVKSSRGVYFTLSFLTMLSKPLGYVRNLIIAWAFGTSAGMDAYNGALSVISLFAGGVGIAVESSVLPEMERVRNESGGDSRRTGSLFAAAVWIALTLTAILCAALAIAPGVLVRFLASGFDEERVRMGAFMIWWLSPFAAITIFRPLAEVWALFNERFTVSAFCAISFNFIAIPALLLLKSVIGPYAVAACMSAGHAVSFIIFLAVIRGLPLKIAPSLISRGSLSRVVTNGFFSMLISFSGTLYTIVDKYFASRLPVGSVSALSYGSLLLGLLNTAALTPISFFLAKISRLVTANPREAEGMTKQCVAVAFTYTLPIAFLSAAAAKPIVSAIFGWGNFDERSVVMTATCLAGYNLGLVFVIPSTILYRYAQARQGLRALTPFFYSMVALNAFLDWAMVGRWGLWGLSLATSITQAVAFVVWYKLMMPDALFRFLLDSRFFWQFAGVSACSALVLASARLGMAAQLSISLAAMAAYLFAAELAGLMPFVPGHWRPTGLTAFLLEAARSALSPRQGK
jgi:putative peptidoglycan lipid II flippase